MTTATTTGADRRVLGALRTRSWEPAHTSGLRILSAGKEQGQTPNQAGPPSCLAETLEDEGSSGTGSVQFARATGKLRPGRPALGPSRAKGRELGNTGPGGAGALGAEVGRGGGGCPKGGVRANKPPFQPTRSPSKHLLKRRLEVTDRLSSRPGATAAHPRTREPERVGGGDLHPCGPAHPGAGNRTSPARGTLPGKWPAPGLRAKFRDPATSPVPGPRARQGARRRSPKPSPCPGSRLPGPREQAGCASPSGRARVGVLQKGETGGSRSVGRTGKRQAERREQPGARRDCVPGSAPVDGAGPAPTRARCRETRVGRRVLCIKAAVTS